MFSLSPTNFFYNQKLRPFGYFIYFPLYSLSSQFLGTSLFFTNSPSGLSSLLNSSTLNGRISVLSTSIMYSRPSIFIVKHLIYLVYFSVAPLITLHTFFLESGPSLVSTISFIYSNNPCESISYSLVSISTAFLKNFTSSGSCDS